jgi:hypothetical protein
MNSWYTYKVLADSYGADRRREADKHRAARRAGRRGRRLWSRSA